VTLLVLVPLVARYAGELPKDAKFVDLFEPIESRLPGHDKLLVAVLAYVFMDCITGFFYLFLYMKNSSLRIYSRAVNTCYD